VALRRPERAGIYVVFYLVMGYAVVKLFGQLAASLYGARTASTRSSAGTSRPRS
jgi:hypothetical protein